MHKNGKTEHCGGRQYGYVRVSSREQNEARQLAAMCNAGIRAEYIFADKQSGRDFERPQYKKLLRRLFLLAAGCLVFAWILLDTEQASSAAKSLWNLISPFVAGAVIAFVFNVPMRAIERQLDGIHKEGLRRVLSIVLTIAALALVIMFVVEMLAPQIQVTVAALTERIPTFIEQTSAKLMQLMDDNPDMKAWIMEVADLESLEWTKILKDSMGFLGNQMSTVMGSAVNVIGSVTSGIVNLVVSIAFAIYCLARKEILARQGRRILYSLIPEKTGDEIIRILRLTNSTFSNFISGQCLEACILGGLFAVTMAIFRMPYIPLVSVIIAVTALVPVVGAFVGCVLGAFFILVDNPLQALTFVAMFLILQQHRQSGTPAVMSEVEKVLDLSVSAVLKIR